MSSDLSRECWCLWAFSEFRKIDVSWLPVTLGSSPRALPAWERNPSPGSEAEAALGWPGLRKEGWSWWNVEWIWIFAGDNRRSKEHGHSRNKKKASVSEGSNQEDRSYARSLVQRLERREKLRGHEADTEAIHGPRTEGSRSHARGWRNKGWGGVARAKMWVEPMEKM